MERIERLKKISNAVRKDIIEMSYSCGRAAHPGPALSCADIVTALYFDVMNFDPQDYANSDRDRFILSKGHACPVQYAALTELGLVTKEEYKRLRHVGATLQGHPTYQKTPGVDMTTGSLGNGLGIGLGMAYYQKLAGSGSRVYVILGDGEINEGTAWEAVMCAPSLKVGNLVAVVDINGFQSCGACSDILPTPDLKTIWSGFGWNVVETDGHDMGNILDAFEAAKSSSDVPTVILARTVKGKGVSFMENNNAWHQHILTEEQFNQAMRDLEVIV